MRHFNNLGKNDIHELAARGVADVVSRDGPLNIKGD
jgi:hypothetical protein